MAHFEGKQSSFFLNIILERKLTAVLGEKLKNMFKIKKWSWNNFFTFSSWMRRYWFYVKNDFRNFHQIFTFWDPLSQKQGFLRKCLSVCLSVGRVRHNSRQNYQIELSFGTLYRSRKSKDKFVNQPHPIKIKGWSTTFVFLKIIF